MDFVTVLLLGIGLAMDAFAVSVCKGLAVRRPGWREYLLVGLWFGIFQAVMPMLGYLLGSALYDAVSTYAYVIAIALLALIGINTIFKAVKGDGEEGVDAAMGPYVMLVLAVATSIDAFAVGISMAMEGADIVPSAIMIGLITMALSMAGMRIGSASGNVIGNRAGILGGIILICIAVKIAVENFVIR